MGGTWLAERLLLVIPLLLSLSVHEWAHAFAAFRLGDDTAKQLGRMTLDPLAHVDFVGTLVLPLLGIPFGWAKPVPVNPVRFVGVSQEAGMMLTAAAGPIANLVLAVGSTALLVVGTLGAPGLFAAGAPFGGVLERAIVLNVLLACSNLLPVPPLDGSRVADFLMPKVLRPVWDRMQGAGGLLLVAVILLPAWLGIDLFAGPRALSDLLVGLAR